MVGKLSPLTNIEYLLELYKSNGFRDGKSGADAAMEFVALRLALFSEVCSSTAEPGAAEPLTEK